MKRIWEILEECKLQETVEGIQKVLALNDTPALREVLRLAYHPNAKWYFSDFPKEYKEPDTLPGVSMTNLYTEIRRIYVFAVGHPNADNLTEQRRKQLFLQFLEGMEKDEAKVVIDIMRGDLQIDGLNIHIINQVFPNLIS